MALLLWRMPLSTMYGLSRSLVWAQSPARDARIAVQVLVSTAVVLVAMTAAFGTMGAVAGMLCSDAIAVIAYARHAGMERVGRLLVPVRALVAAALAAAAVLAMPAEPRATRVSLVLAVWVVSMAGAVWPCFAPLRRLLDDQGEAPDAGSRSLRRFG